MGNTPDISSVGSELIVGGGVIALLSTFAPFVALAVGLIWIVHLVARWSATPDVQLIPVPVQTEERARRRRR